MTPSYFVELISMHEKDNLISKIYSKDLYERKAIIHGTCVKFFTDNCEFQEMWEENFEMMPDWIRPHARVFAISSKINKIKNKSKNRTKKLRVRYEPISKTIIIENCNYYGWVKSIALALVADFLEDFTSEHRRYSVHGSFVDFGGRGLALIGPSGSGKTTLTYGLLMDRHANFVTDDWFFVRFSNYETLIYSSEKNSYIRGDLGAVWSCYRGKLKDVKRDLQDRSVINVRRLLGAERIRTESTLSGTVLLTRDKKLLPFSKLTPKQAIDFMLKTDFCNPHQLIRSKEKLEKRKNFFSELFKKAPVYLLNTIETPEESLARLKKLIGQEV